MLLFFDRMLKNMLNKCSHNRVYILMVLLVAVFFWPQTQQCLTLYIGQASCFKLPEC